MSNSFRAILLNDVCFRDFYGRLHTVKAGATITVFQILSDKCVSMDALGRTIRERKNSFIGAIGKFGFDIDRLEFQVAH